MREGEREVKRRKRNIRGVTSICYCKMHAHCTYLCWTVSRSSFSMSGASWYTSRMVECSMAMRYNS